MNNDRNYKAFLRLKEFIESHQFEVYEYAVTRTDISYRKCPFPLLTVIDNPLQDLKGKIIETNLFTFEIGGLKLDEDGSKWSDIIINIK